MFKVKHAHTHIVLLGYESCEGDAIPREMHGERAGLGNTTVLRHTTRLGIDRASLKRASIRKGADARGHGGLQRTRCDISAYSLCYRKPVGLGLVLGLRYMLGNL